MDEFQLLGVVAVSVGVGFIAATVKHGRQMRNFQRYAASNHIESLTRLLQAALKTLVEDYKLDENEATKKLFVRAEEAGMKLRAINPDTGEVVKP